MQNSETTQVMSGAQILIEALHAEGVVHVFGYPGGSVLPIYDEIYKQRYFKHFLVRHEQAAVHAADAYSRTTDQVGVAICTSGPGLRMRSPALLRRMPIRFPWSSLQAGWNSSVSVRMLFRSVIRSVSRAPVQSIISWFVMSGSWQTRSRRPFT